MAGETIKSKAICLDIRPWSQTSHVVSWLTPNGRVATVVKGAVRPKSLFLGQYDLNYTCEILYYARAKGELHALRDCVPLVCRDALRSSYRLLALAGYFRQLVAELAPAGADCGVWFEALERHLDACVSAGLGENRVSPIAWLIRFELKVLELAGLAPDFSGYDENAEWSTFSVENGTFENPTGRCIRVSKEVAAYLRNPYGKSENPQVPLDAARVIGVFYAFHVENAPDIRREVLSLVINNKEGNGSK